MRLKLLKSNIIIFTIYSIVKEMEDWANYLETIQYNMCDFVNGG